MKKTIFVIDDDEKLNKLLKDYLNKFGFATESFTSPQRGIAALRKRIPELIILDVMLPEMDGFEVCRRIRRDFTIPIIMLTARGEVTDRIVGLEMGADDYLPKPFEPRELVARIQSILKRSNRDSGADFKRYGALSINYKKMEVRLDEENINLTTAEFEILSLLVKRAGMVFSRNQILDHLWDIEWAVYNRSVDVLISRLRQKLKDDPKDPRFIKTIWGAGYVFVGEE